MTEEDDKLERKLQMLLSGKLGWVIVAVGLIGLFSYAFNSGYRIGHDMAVNHIIQNGR